MKISIFVLNLLPQVLKNIDLEIRQGIFVGVVGQSGSGKSTLMKLLPRLYSPESGRILIDDYDIDKVELYSLEDRLALFHKTLCCFQVVSAKISLLQIRMQLTSQ